ncbi:MAG: amidohydrolase [Spirochaetaceae bacterium]|nr:amidohydrolase [Spirochaetaceae bacterium]
MSFPRLVPVKKTVLLLFVLMTVVSFLSVQADDLSSGDTAGAKKIATDCHVHVMSGQFASIFKVLIGGDSYNGNTIEEFSADKVVALLDEAKLNRAFVLSGSYILGMQGIEGPDEYNDVKKENNYLAVQCAKNPERLIGFFSINPLKDYAIEEVDRCYDVLKLPGLKLHFTNSNVDLTNPEHLEKIQKLFAHAAKKGIPILLHFRSRSPEFGKRDADILINDVIAKTPGLRLQIAHLGGWGGFDKGTEEMFTAFIEAYRNNPNLDKSNIVFDLSGALVTENEAMKGELDATSPEQNERMVALMREWGLENIVFGSDRPFSTPANYIKNIRKFLPLSDSELDAILNNDTSERLFGCKAAEIRHPDLQELLKTLTEGEDYDAPLSIKLGQ